MWKREYDILETQSKQKVDNWQAEKIVYGQESIEEWTETLTYRQHVYMETDAGTTRRSYPFELEKNLRHQFNVPREDIITERNGFVIKTITADEHSRSMTADRIVNIQCPISADNPGLRLYKSKRGIVYQNTM